MGGEYAYPCKKIQSVLIPSHSQRTDTLDQFSTSVFKKTSLSIYPLDL